MGVGSERGQMLFSMAKLMLSYFIVCDLLDWMSCFWLTYFTPVDVKEHLEPLTFYSFVRWNQYTMSTDNKGKWILKYHIAC